MIYLNKKTQHRYLHYVGKQEELQAQLQREGATPRGHDNQAAMVTGDAEDRD